MFLKAPVIYDPDNFPGNSPGNLREVVTSRKVTGKTLNNKMAAGGGLFGLVRRPRSYQRRPILADMADCEVIERIQAFTSKNRVARG